MLGIFLLAMVSESVKVLEGIQETSYKSAASCLENFYWSCGSTHYAMLLHCSIVLKESMAFNCSNCFC